jgi:hypothetical protein
VIARVLVIGAVAFAFIVLLTARITLPALTVAALLTWAVLASIAVLVFWRRSRQGDLRWTIDDPRRRDVGGRRLPHQRAAVAYARCRTCTGKGTNAGSSRRRFGTCRRCEGSGRRERLGTRLIFRKWVGPYTRTPPPGRTGAGASWCTHLSA